MRYLALAADYDGTLATDSVVGASTLAALCRLKDSGRKLLLVTGRVLPELQQCLGDGIELFDWVIAENGGLLYRPQDHSERLLAASPPEKLVRALEERGVTPLSLGRVILATWHPHETVALEVIRDLGLEYQVIFNKGAVMLLPAGVNKSSGLLAALAELGMSPHNVVGVGDAENDHAFLGVCECSVAVANAIDALKATVDWTAPQDHGAGVESLIGRLLDNDLAELEPRLGRHHILLGAYKDAEEVRISPFGVNLLIAGESGSGKSTLAAALVERLIQQNYEVCVIDPEGDHGGVEGAVTVGGPQHRAAIDEVARLLSHAGTNVVANLAALRFDERPGFFLTMYDRLREPRSARGVPHWLVIDEAHHVLPADWPPELPEPPAAYCSTAFVVADPAKLELHAAKAIDLVVAGGDAFHRTLQRFCERRELRLPEIPENLECGEMLIWRPGEPRASVMHAALGALERRRHRRKYAQGDLGEERSFYFRGADEKLNLQAQNLAMFLHLAAGVDDETWLYHLRRGDYSQWFRSGIKDEELADRVAEIERLQGLPVAESRKKLCELIEQEYTLPASS